MNNNEINNKKTAEDAKESSASGLISLGLAYSIASALEMDAETRGVAMPIMTAGIMGVIKTIIRRVRNRWKHRRKERENETGEVNKD